ncbi:MAG: hypothetical protein WAX69_22660 [Victivallales bacterium]
MKNAYIILSLLSVAYLSGCTTLTPTGTSRQIQMKNTREDMMLADKKIALMSLFESNPDINAWYEQRQKIAQASGDRIFDKDFGRVYDSLVLAVSTMELKVNNMERTSGYIQATGALPPSESQVGYREVLNEWCRQKEFDSSILDKKYFTMDGSNELIGATSAYAKKAKVLTFQLVKMGDNQTKVKLRFSDVFFPPELESYYKTVWQVVDKQIFVDQNIEGAVESRAEPALSTSPKQ